MPPVPSPTMNDNSNKRRRNVILFWVHVGLVVVVLAGFVYSVSHK